MYDVYFYEAFAEEETALRAALPAGIRAGYTRLTIQEAGAANIPPCPLISIRTQSQIPSAWIGPLQAVLSRSTGYDHLLPYGDALQCGYLPLYCARAVAEQALLLMLALLRKLPAQRRNMAHFDRDGLTGLECLGKTLSVFGVGNIGHCMASIGTALGMHVLGVDIVQRHDDVTYCAPDAALQQADVIVCAMNLTPRTRAYFNRDRLRMTPPGVIFINIARGEMALLADLAALLQSGHIVGVGLDVFDNEAAIAVDFRRNTTTTTETDLLRTLLSDPRVVLTPHNAFNTAESVARKAADSARQVTHYQTHRQFYWPLPRQESD